MTHEIKIGDTVLEIEDTILFEKQPNPFKKIFNEIKLVDMAEFDNCYVSLLQTGRTLITMKEDGNNI